jgi:hypothetical protein
MASVGRGTMKHVAVALAAALALTLQALLATWTPPHKPPTAPSDHGAHHAADHGAHALHDALPGADPSEPTPASENHHKFCCILGKKLGTAMGPAPVSLLLPPRRLAAAAAPLHRPLVLSVFRTPARPLGARAPPLMS